MLKEKNNYYLENSIDLKQENELSIEEFIKKYNNNNNKIILITGGEGFLGYHLCKILLNNPINKIICLDNLISGSFSTIEEFQDNPHFLFIHFDVQNKINFSHIDEIYHLACIASFDIYKKNIQ